MFHFYCFATALMIFTFCGQKLNLNAEVIFISILVSILKTFIIAFRYSTASETRMTEIYIKKFTEKDNSAEYLDLAWRDIMPNNIDNEIKASMIRNEIENKTFQICLL